MLRFYIGHTEKCMLFWIKLSHFSQIRCICLVLSLHLSRSIPGAETIKLMNLLFFNHLSHFFFPLFFDFFFLPLFYLSFFFFLLSVVCLANPYLSVLPLYSRLFIYVRTGVFRSFFSPFTYVSLIFKAFKVY